MCLHTGIVTWNLRLGFIHCLFACTSIDTKGQRSSRNGIPNGNGRRCRQSTAGGAFRGANIVDRMLAMTPSKKRGKRRVRLVTIAQLLIPNVDTFAAVQAQEFSIVRATRINGMLAKRPGKGNGTNAVRKFFGGRVYRVGGIQVCRVVRCGLPSFVLWLFPVAAGAPVEAFQVACDHFLRIHNWTSKVFAFLNNLDSTRRSTSILVARGDHLHVGGRSCAKLARKTSEPLLAVATFVGVGSTRSIVDAKNCTAIPNFIIGRTTRCGGVLTVLTSIQRVVIISRRRAVATMDSLSSFGACKAFRTVKAMMFTTCQPRYLTRGTIPVVGTLTIHVVVVVGVIPKAIGIGLFGCGTGTNSANASI
jgi:hypothetical protein